MQSLHASQIGWHAARTLHSVEGLPFGKIIASFPNSFYIKTHYDELIFITNRSFRSPSTINVEYSGPFTDIAKPLEPLFFREHQLNSSVLSIDLTNAHEWKEEKSLPIPNYSKLMDVPRILAIILNMIDTSGSLLDRNEALHDSMGRFVKDGILPIIDNEASTTFAASASKIIGLGSGFTPSGDDFLLGFLAIFNSLARTVQRSPIYLGLGELVKLTNWISAKLLDYAQHLELDDQLLRVIRSLSAENDDTAIALESLIARGHTSGIDITTGAVLGLSVACDIALKQRRTQMIARNLGYN